ncbi:MAG TPA: hypothetical protein VGX48_01690 [Pyrinomonadaceae bacterium]|jgi:hypothetical protein|nr:hypothetical protein [Pyrinomonadaceae bacterium]
MKKQIARTFTAALGLLMLFAAAAVGHAQTGRRAVVEVPFDFYAGQRQMPAGRYTVRPVSQDGSKMLLIQSEDGRASSAVLTYAAEGPAAPAAAGLTFRQYGGQYFLATVFIKGAAGARELPASKAEKRLRTDLRAKAADPEAKSVTVIGSVQ